MQPHIDRIREFYDAFQRRDHRAMAACYAPGAHFRDAVFIDLYDWKIAAMWRMLCERATDLELTVTNIRADAYSGFAHWEARYTFSATGRLVHNVIEARFEFSAGRFQRHVDEFDLYRWSRQAFGVSGLVLGWSTFMQRRIRAHASRGLDSFTRKHALGPGSR